MNEVKFKITNGYLPEKKTTGAGAFDLYSAVEMKLEPGETGLIKLGIHTQFDKGLVGVLRDRSSFAIKGFFISAGVIDSDYTGEWMVVMNNRSLTETFSCNKGERIAQVLFLPVPKIQFKVVTEIESTDRGTGGFGSTGKN